MIMRIGKLQLRFYASILEKRVGVCSDKNTGEDKHALLWDFDNSNISDIIHTLTKLLLKYNLPAIYIISSSPYSYHAYCFTARPFREIIHILSDTPEIDDSYFRLGIVRGYYTLRITPRKNEEFKLVKVIASVNKNEIDYMELTLNEYFTSNKGKGGKRHAKK